MKNLKAKLASRKFWACVAGVVSGLAIAFGLDGDTITGVSGAVVSLTSIAAYIMAEASVDRESIRAEAEMEQAAYQRETEELV